MRSIDLFVVFCFLLVDNKIQTVVGSYATNYSDDFYAIVKSALYDLSVRRNDPTCRKVENLRRRANEEKTRKPNVHALSKFRRKEDTDLVARSYYGGYGASPMAPALYPAIDTVSVLASLAFLAFLLHSFASLFDRSRSIIPSIVSNRQITGERGIPDPVKLVFRALDEYDILSNDVFEDPKFINNQILHQSAETSKSSDSILRR